MNAEEVPLSLLTLPSEILSEILSYVKFHTLSELRLVCTKFDVVCQSLLNKGFNDVKKWHANVQRTVKSRLPRRESDRRKHTLARHVDILSAVETRLSLLSMTYSKYIEKKVACFIPGKVLDELTEILRTVCDLTEPPRVLDFLQELRDISSMAMEHFEDKIAPPLKVLLPGMSSPSISDYSRATSSSSPLNVSCVSSPESCQKHFCTPNLVRDVKNLQMSHNSKIVTINRLNKQLNDTNKSLTSITNLIGEKSKIIKDQQEMIEEQTKTNMEILRRVAFLERRLSVQSQLQVDNTTATSTNLEISKSFDETDTDSNLHDSKNNVRRAIRSKGFKRCSNDFSDSDNTKRRKR